MGFQLKSGNRHSLKGGVVEPSCKPMCISIAVVDGTPMQKRGDSYAESYTPRKRRKLSDAEALKIARTTGEAIDEDNAAYAPGNPGGVGNIVTSPMAKASPYKEEEEEEDDFNMMENTPDPDPETMGPEPDPDPDPPSEETPGEETPGEETPPEEDPEEVEEEDKKEETEEEKETEDLKEEVEQSEDAANEEFLDNYMQENLGITSEEIDSMKETQEAKTETEKIEDSVKSESEKMEEQYQKDMAEGKYEENPEAAADDYLKMIDAGMEEDKEAERDQFADHQTQAEWEKEEAQKVTDEVTQKATDKTQKLVSDKVEKQVLGDTIENKATQKVVEQLAKQEAKAAAQKQLIKKAALKTAGKVALKFIPGVNLLSTGYDVFKLGQHAWRNRDHIKQWANNQSDSMKNKMNEWTG